MIEQAIATATGRITDVPGLRVGHSTIVQAGGIRTGVTAVLPSANHIYRQKLPAAAHVFNGYGKSTGLIQVAELGCIETPIVLTNTLAVGTAHTALVRHMLAHYPEIGRGAGTVNPVVMECNDGEVNDLRALAVAEKDVQAALACADVCFDEGDVGAGAGMVCFSLKGGIGTSSRGVPAGQDNYVLGCLVLSNFGSLKDFTPLGRREGPRLMQQLQALQHPPQPQPEKGSIIVLLATNAPLCSRQLGRVARRAGVGIARTGSFVGNYSGEICLAFSTANPIADTAHPPQPVARLYEGYMDAFFAATADAVEEAILRSMWHAHTVDTYTGGKVFALRDVDPAINL